MATQLTYASASGEERVGAFQKPADSGKSGGIVVVQEWWGLSDHIKTLCDRFAEAGFLALAPDLYHGKIAKTKEEAGRMMGGLDTKKAVAEIADAAARLKAEPGCNGRVAVVGFCMGGALTLAAACSVDGLAAAVPFYGLPQLPLDAYARVKTPLQAHFARRDDWAKSSVAEEIQKTVRSGGGQMDLFVYDAGHAFMRSTDPEVYDATNARLAWERAIDFLRKHLAA
jgi:carboxymethylenebutenolidase